MKSDMSHPHWKKIKYIIGEGLDLRIGRQVLTGKETVLIMLQLCDENRLSLEYAHEAFLNRAMKGLIKE